MQANGFLLFGVLADHEPHRIDPDPIGHNPLCTEIVPAPFRLIHQAPEGDMNTRGLTGRQPEISDLIKCRKAPPSKSSGAL